MRGKKRGEMLIEGLISMFIISVALIPVSNILTRTMANNIKVENEMDKIEVEKNIIEIIKTKDKNELKKIYGVYEVEGIDEFYSRFNIEENYRLLNKNTGINKLRIEIDKDGIKVNEVEEKS